MKLLPIVFVIVLFNTLAWSEEEQMTGVEKEIAEALAAGKISEKEADDKLAWVAENESKDSALKKWKRQVGEIKKAVADGSISKEEGEKKYKALEKMWADYKKKKASGKAKQMDFDQLEEEIDAAEKSGEISSDLAVEKREWVKQAKAAQK